MARKPRNEDTTPIIDKEDHIINKEFIELLDERFTNYAFAVMEDRALPDARDGPVSYTHLTLPTILLV